MNRRRTEGSETFHRLQQWTQDSAASERLAAQLLRVEGYIGVDPSHPLGGPDGLKDAVCLKDDQKWIGAAYFPRGDQTPGAIKEKLLSDLAGVAANQAAGLAFVTNQELRLREREELTQIAEPVSLDIFHLERIASLLDSPPCYGIRLDFLDIEMNKEEQLAFIADRDAMFKEALDQLMEKFNAIVNRGDAVAGTVSVPLGEMKEFKSILDTISGSNAYGFVYAPSGSIFGSAAGHITRLQVPLAELRAFADLLDRITGSAGVSSSFALSTVVGGSSPGHVSRLHVPLGELKEYEAHLDRIIAKRLLLPHP